MEEKKDFEKMLQEAIKKEEYDENRNSNTTIQQSPRTDVNRLSGSITDSNRTSLKESTTLDFGRYALYSNENQQNKGDRDFKDRNRKESISTAESEGSQDLQTGSRAEIASSGRIREGSQSTRNTSQELHSFNAKEIWRYNLQESAELAQITQALNQQKGSLIYQAGFFKRQAKELYEQYNSYYPSAREEKLNSLMKQFNTLLQNNAFKDNPLMVEDRKILDFFIKEFTNSKKK
ncbi:hypothetical protein IP364_04000 [Helicobacter winghamensis]|uniref:hypothetical protein n=1 Tax=Helicobacter winghamensis TaxID=157268 RepID=UPI0027A736A3